MDGQLALHSNAYPERLKATPDAPASLNIRGTLPPADSSSRPWIAIVGARAASGAAMEIAGDTAYAVARAGGVVVSGGALGVDAAGHRGALEAGGETVAVLAAGFDHLYPAAHRPLFAEIAEAGALVSPYDAGVPPRRYHFVRRNRIIAGLCDVVLVVEASRSSGSLYTARAARDYGRKLAAVEGSPGCEQLIAEGAFPLSSAGEILSFASGRLEAPAAPMPANELEREVLASLGSKPRSAAELADEIGSGPREIDRALAALELARLALAVPGRAYVRSALGETVRS